ncbi:MAG TPA: amino acid racemase [Pyrinomonadaceae bacterium]|nr:amino acid racemase [Pyrinomonadaceae bacterium]
MKTVGIVGGIGPESTIEYYRFIIAGYRERTTDGSYPLIIINSVDLTRLIAWINAGELGPFANYLAASIEQLANAGADFAVLAANTGHIVFDQLRQRSRIPLLSIAEATCERARAQGLKRLGLIGTRFTMEATFYPEVFSRNGLTIVTPNETERAFINEKYFDELLKNVFLPETRDQLLLVINQLKLREAIDGLILGGTELPLILRDADAGLPFLDTTKIHVERIVDEMLI